MKLVREKKCSEQVSMAASEIFKFRHVDTVIQLSVFHIDSLKKETLIIKPQILDGQRRFCQCCIARVWGDRCY